MYRGPADAGTGRPLGVKFPKEVQQVDQRAAQAIDRPGSDHVDVAAGDGLEQTIKAGTLTREAGRSSRKKRC
jgi:hypothetical protein